MLVDCEQSPDDNDRTRLDQITYRVKSENLVLTQIVIVESKRQGQGVAHIRKAEDQMLDGCTRSWKHSHLPQIHGLTTWRTKFRGWTFDVQSQKLEALDGPDTVADKSSYTDIADAEDLSTLVVSLVKGADIEAPPVLLGQQGYESSQSSLPVIHDPQPSTLPLQQEDVNEPQHGESLLPLAPSFIQPDDDAGEGSSSMPAHGGEELWIQVYVTVREQVFKKNEWCFTDAKGLKGLYRETNGSI